MQYMVGIQIADDFHPETGWSWGEAAHAVIPFDSKEEALSTFRSKQRELPTLAAVNCVATRIFITDSAGAHLQGPITYDGEDVFGWHAAYKVHVPIPGRAPRVDRFVDVIGIHIGYYAFMKRYGHGPGIFVDAIADTLEEAIHQLGEKSQSYRLIPQL